ncbi:hypothetical protein OG444_40245 (plasmid) [Streptomyces sp. NBC_01232]|uniref:hypothetical protein n=1 Tax=Streptomyces sp. NBC_01232 TaxID=2903786 RepID=UPI002E136599|nr:hypothetical protein OG444_00015 [Streptomyces sp. NBC_01232]WSQ03272.1 hypothetical protein OG444_39810 [Streptomyces sp. NBC_01232]WSQ03885.1 hypothetical protein OG444_40245 [Streptomyces sp. NBC_01232]
MNVHIAPLTAAIFVTSAVVAYLVYKATAKARGQAPGTGGDVVGSIGSGAAVFAVLMILFTGGTDEQDAIPSAPPASRSAPQPFPASHQPSDSLVGHGTTVPLESATTSAA